MDFFGQLGQSLVGRSAIGARLAIAVLGLLHQAGQANLDELVQVAGGDSQKFHAFQKGIAGIAGFFEDALIKVHPGEVPIKEALGIGNDFLTHAASEAGKGIA